MKLADLISDRVHPEDIAVMLGRHPVAIRKVLPKDYDPLPRAEITYGLSARTDGLRARLGSIIASMTEAGYSREQIGEITGLNQRQSFKAERRPFGHDWTLSQIERTLRWHDDTGNTSIGILDSSKKKASR